jgi:peptide/nickel transport system ATP-binding protein
VQQCEERQMAMLLISHDLPLVAEHCDRVLVMYQGERSMRWRQAGFRRRRIRTRAPCGPAVQRQTFGQMLPTLDRTQPWKEADNGAR